MSGKKFVEKNIIIKKWQENQLKIALIYPNRYSAMSGLTVQMLYHLWNSFSNVVCERFFMPDDIILGRYKNEKKREVKSVSTRKYNFGSDLAGRTPPIRSIESGMPLSHFDICAFTISYELDFSNIYWMLENGEIPPLREDRKKIRDDSDNQEIYSELPLIMAGGPVIRSNPLPLANIIDLAFIGEIEPINSEFINTWFNNRGLFLEYDSDEYYKKIMVEFSKILGFWVPSLNNKPVKRVFINNLDNSPHPTSQIIPQSSEILREFPFGQSIYVEVNRGCNYSCHFCITGHQIKPFRNRSLAQLKQIVLEAIDSTGVKKVVLIGSSILDHPDFMDLCNFFLDMDLEFSIPSARAEIIDENIAAILGKSGMKTIAIAPEAGNDQMRKRLNKRTTNAEILNACTHLLKSGIPNIKLYMIYGFPFETDEDACTIADFTKEIADLGYGKRSVRLSLNPFIPKAHTPFQANIDNYLSTKMEVLKKREKMILQALKGNVQIKTQTLSLEEAYIQTIFSLADERITHFIKEFSDLGYSSRRWFRTLKQPDNQQIIEDLFQTIKSNKKLKKPQFWDFIRI